MAGFEGVRAVGVGSPPPRILVIVCWWFVVLVLLLVMVVLVVLVLVSLWCLILLFYDIIPPGIYIRVIVVVRGGASFLFRGMVMLLTSCLSMLSWLCSHAHMPPAIHAMLSAVQLSQFLLVARSQAFHTYILY